MTATAALVHSSGVKQVAGAAPSCCCYLSCCMCTQAFCPLPNARLLSPRLLVVCCATSCIDTGASLSLWQLPYPAPVAVPSAERAVCRSARLWSKYVADGPSVMAVRLCCGVVCGSCLCACREGGGGYQPRDYRGPSDYDNVETFGMGAAG